MRLTSFANGVLSLAVLLRYTIAQNSIPPDLSSNFSPDSISLQASFVGDASDGFSDGTTFSKAQTSKTPSFALGDASGISTVRKFVIAMVDITCDNARTLHFLGTDFQSANFKTTIDSDADPVVPYSQPGSFGEKGNRRYAFLMYFQPTDLTASSVAELPTSDGQVFDVAAFEKANTLGGASAGVSFNVDLGGQANCQASGGGGASSSAFSSAVSSAVSSAFSSALSSAAESSSQQSAKSTSAASSVVASSTPAAVSSILASTVRGTAASSTGVPAQSTNGTFTGPARTRASSSTGVSYASTVIGSTYLTSWKTIGAPTTSGAAGASGAVGGSAGVTGSELVPTGGVGESYSGGGLEGLALGLLIAVGGFFV